MLDIAEEKLQKLPENVQSRVSLNQGDMTNFELGSKFAMVIVPWLFKYLLTTEDQLACFRQVHKHLNDDGVFILDFSLEDFPRTLFDEYEIHSDCANRIQGYIISFPL
jgi:hypothetical protein